MSSASSKSAAVSIALTAVVLILAAQGTGFVIGFAIGFVRALSGGSAPERAALASALLPFTFLAMALAALIMGAWLQARHTSTAGITFLAALATGGLNAMGNYFVGHDPNLTAMLQNTPAQPAILIGAVIGVLIIVLILWGILLAGGQFAGLFRSKRAA
jgi:hypothetical protein